MKKKMKKKDTSVFFENNKLLFAVSTVFLIIVNILSCVYAYIMQVLLDACTGGNVKQLVTILVEIISLFLAFFIAQMILNKIRCAFVRRSMSQYKNKVFNLLSHKSIASFVNERTSSYVSILTNDVTVIENGYINGLFDIISMCTSLAGALLLMIWYNWIMTLVVLFLCIVPIVMSVFIGDKIAHLEKNISDKNEKFVSIIKDLLMGFPVVKSFQAEEQAINLFCDENTDLEKGKEKRKATEGTIKIIANEVGSFIQIAVFLMGAFLAIKGYITAGVVIAFVQLMNNVMEPIQSLPALFANRKAAKRLIAKMEQYASNNEVKDGNEVIDDIGEGIEFEHVGFSYEEGNYALHNISLKIEKGKHYGIVGGSGSGKSTLLNLLMGGFLNYEGNIYIDKKEIRDIKRECLYQLLSSVQQNVFIFDNSILNNITMFKSFDEEQVNRAVKMSGLEKLIHEKGYDYLCGENGINLSGGERQRISIARCILKNTSVILMDEATAALDSETAKTVMTQILEMDELTSIVVTHSMGKSVLERFDKIFVLQNGTIVEAGTFQELLKNKKYFYALYSLSGEQDY